MNSRPFPLDRLQQVEYDCRRPQRSYSREEFDRIVAGPCRADDARGGADVAAFEAQLREALQVPVPQVRQRRKRRTLDGNGGPDLDFGCLGRLALLVTILAAGVGLRLWCDALWRTCPAVVVALAVGAVVAVAAWTAKRMGVRR